MPALNLALGGGTAMEAYYVLVRYLEQHPPPKTVLLSLSPYHFQESLFWERLTRYHFLRFREQREALDALREDQGYELWWIDAGVPHPAGVFQPDASGRVLHEFHADQPLAESAVLAVTIEPRAGVAAPTGAIVLAQR